MILYSLVYDFILKVGKGFIILRKFYNFGLDGYVCILIVCVILNILIFRSFIVNQRSLLFQSLRSKVNVASLIRSELSNFESIKSLGLEERSAQRMEHRYDDRKNTKIYFESFRLRNAAIYGLFEIVCRIFMFLLKYFTTLMITNDPLKVKFLDISDITASFFDVTAGLILFLEEFNTNISTISSFENETLPDTGKITSIEKVQKITFKNVKSGSNSIDFTVYDGESVAIVGINNTGKSTFLKMFSGIIKPEYEIYLNDNSITDLNKS